MTEKDLQIIGRSRIYVEVPGTTEAAAKMAVHRMRRRYRRLLREEVSQFEVDTVNGQVLKLADCRGKYVLVHFWATWCGPCMIETPRLNAVSDAFGDDERVVMIGLSLDSDLDSWKRYVDRNKNHWIQAFLGGRNKSAVPNRYGLQGIPETFLVGPDGKILARGLRGEAIEKAVANSLK